MMLAAVPLGMIPAIVTVFVIRRAGAERIARVHVRAELCGSCGYELRGIAPEADGCTVCPECGGAWSVEGGGGERGMREQGMGNREVKDNVSRLRRGFGRRSRA
jgi:Zn-finger nucleic acid-binding protein